VLKPTLDIIIYARRLQTSVRREGGREGGKKGGRDTFEAEAQPHL